MYLANLTGDATAQSLFEDGDRAARAEVPTFDTGAWSLYSRGSITRESDLGYHKLLIDFLKALCGRTAAVEYYAAEQHFNEYLVTLFVHPVDIETAPLRIFNLQKTGGMSPATAALAVTMQLVSFAAVLVFFRVFGTRHFKGTYIL